MAERPVLYKDVSKSDLPNIPITEGQLLVVDDGGIYLDKDNVRREVANITNSDDAFSTTSENALQNKVITNSLRANNNQFYFDYQNGVYGFNTNPSRTANTFKPFDSTVVDSAFSTTSTNPLQNKVITNALRANNNQFYFDYQDGKYGFNTSPNRGADTFTPFKKFELTTQTKRVYFTLGGTYYYNVYVYFSEFSFPTTVVAITGFNSGNISSYSTLTRVYRTQILSESNSIVIEVLNENTTTPIGTQLYFDITVIGY